MGLRYHSQDKGGIFYISNTILDCGQAQAQNERPPLGVSNNNDYVMRFIDVDSSANTFNSSSASLSIPDCSTIEFAGLYWAGHFLPSSANKNSVKIKLPWESSYRDLKADLLSENQYFKDITYLFKSHSSVNGIFTIANVDCEQGQKNIYGGWTIVVVYKNNLLPLRDLSVFDGVKGVGQSSTINFSINGFSSPPSGPVDIDFGFVCYDGDRGASGDYLKFNNQLVGDKLHDPNNIFNSTISYMGELSRGRYPSYNNTLGYDASIIRLDNTSYKFLKNSGTEAAITLGTNNDGYSVGVMSTVIDIYNPFFTVEHNFNNVSIPSKTSLGYGEIGEFSYKITNVGNDNSKVAYFLDSIPSLLDYVEGSMEICYDDRWVSLSDLSGDDAAAYDKKGRCLKVRIGESASAKEGIVRPGDTIKIRYKARTIADQDVVRCSSLKISKYAWVEYSGNINPNWVSKVHSESIASTGICGTKEPLALLLEALSIEKEIIVNVCSGTPVSDFHLAAGYSLFKADDITFQYPLDKLVDPGLYKAYRKLSTGCEYSFNVIARADSVTIYSQPDNIEATVGSGVAFSVGVRGENVSFQWQVNKGDGTWEDIAGATERSLTIPKVTEEMDGYNYRLRVTTPCKDYLLSVKVVLSVKKQPVSKPSEEPEPQPEVQDQNVGALFVPNAFMPASNTQELRSFVVKGHGLAKWQMTIFNKWDQVIWKTDVIGADGSPAEGWDGKMFGSDAPQGAYMWAIEAVFEDGKEWEGMSVRDSKPRKSGVVYLLR